VYGNTPKVLIFSRIWCDGAIIWIASTIRAKSGVIAMNNLSKQLLRNFESAHKEDIETITQVLARITTKSPDEIKPHLDAMLERLVQPQRERPLYETATPEELAQAFWEWASSHDRNSPLLSDYAVSRESMYDNEEL